MSLPPYSSLLQCLYRADAGTWQNTAGTTPATADGDPVARWDDQSDNGQHLIANASATLKTNQINTTLPCIRFDGSTNWFRFPNVFCAAIRTQYAVVKIPDTGVYTIACGESGSLQWRADTLKQRLVSAGVADLGFGTNTFSANAWVSLNVTWNGAAGVFRQANAADGTASGSDYAAPGPNRYLGINAHVFEVFKTDMALFMMFAEIHDTTQRQAVEAWITGIWGV